MPMLVGLVRGATMSDGCSWILSGGSQFSVAVTNVSKNRHVRRDSFLRNCCCLSESRTGCATNGRLNHHAISGDRAQAITRAITVHGIALPLAERIVTIATAMV